MSKTYIFVRKQGITGTKILETTRKEAIKYLKENRSIIGTQIGILGRSDYKPVKSVYGEYAPFQRIKSIAELK